MKVAIEELDPQEPLVLLCKRQAESHGMTMEQYEAWSKTRVPVGTEDDQMPLPWEVSSK